MNTANDAGHWLQQGLAAYRGARYREAAEAFRQALLQQPEDAELWNNYAAALSEAGQPRAALGAAQQAVARDPHSLPALNNLGGALDRCGRPLEAAEVYRRALAVGENAAVWNNLGNVLKAAGRGGEAIAAYRAALRLDPHFTRAHSNLLLVLNYQPDLSAVELAQAQRDYGRALAQRVPRRPPPVSDGPRRAALTVGFVSADCYNHPVGRLLLPVLQARARAAVRWLLYVQNTVCDEITDALRAAADGWCNIAALDDDALEARVRTDGVDLLVDLSGHTAGNRLPFFARHAVPVQAAWLGYAGSTGLTAIDWIIADAHTLPPQDEALYTERVWRLPGSYIAFAPPQHAPAPADPPCLRRGYVSFASFNNLAKLSPAVLATWAALLKRLPDARLRFKNRGFADAGLQQDFRARFAALGVAPQRLDFEGESHGATWYERFAEVDIALDPFPFAGLMTSLDTLWMGVPLITLAGRRGMFSRHGELLARAVGAPEWVADCQPSPERPPALLPAAPDALPAAGVEPDYVARALALAQDPGRLLLWRHCLRAVLAHSPLLAPARLAAELNHAFVGMVAQSTANP